MPWALTRGDTEFHHNFCTRWTRTEFGIRTLHMGAPSGNRAKADLRTHLSTFLAMASIATNKNFRRAMPDSWLRTLTVAVGGSAPTCIFVPIAQGFKRLNHQGGIEFNSCLLWSTACILAISAEAPNATMVGQIAEVLELHFNGSHRCTTSATPPHASGGW